MRTSTFAIALLALSTMVACSGSPTAPTIAQDPKPASRPADPAIGRSGIFINATGEGMIPCDWDLAPVCGPGRFASCVQHGTGLGQPGPIARWESSEWQCFPESWLPRH